MTKSVNPLRIGSYLAATVALAGVVLAGSALSASSAVLPHTGTNCVASVCITVNGTGLEVDSVKVQNNGGNPGTGKITNVGAEEFHNSANQISSTGFYSISIGRSVAQNDQFCGQIGTGPVACLLVHS